MYKKQMLVQRIVCFATLAAAVLVFVYSLGLVTDLHYNNFTYYAEIPGSPVFEGADIYNEIQPFNKALTTAGIILIISSVLVFIFGSHSRRKYYIGNYITIGLNTLLTLGVSVWGIVNVIKYRAMYDQIDFEALKMWQQLLKEPYDISPFWFDAGFYVFGIAIFIAVLGVLNLVFKVMVMKNEKQLLAEV